MDSVIASDGSVTKYFYDAVGNRDSVYNANGTGTGYHYDNLNRLTTVANYGPDGSIISGYTYTLNKAGIRTGVTEADGSEVSYSYDGLYRLTGETRTGANPYAITYTYDNVGNRLTQVKDGASTAYTYNNRDQLTSEISTQNGSIVYAYDHAGRQTTKTDATGTTNYVWIDNDRMVSVSGPATAVTYEYDAEGRRVSETTAGSTKNYLIDALLPYGQVIAETDGIGNPVVSYVYGQDRISMTRGSGTHYYLADGQGSIRQLTDGVGSVTDSWVYSAFGEVVSRTGTTENSFTYTGEQWDPNAGFYYLRARWYNPTDGTFTSVDPWEGDPQSPVSLHRYLYANSSPMIYRDPSGNMSLTEGMLAIGLLYMPSASMISVVQNQNHLVGDISWDIGISTGLHELEQRANIALMAAAVVTVTTVADAMQRIRDYAETIRKQVREDPRKEWLICGPSMENGGHKDNWLQPVRLGGKIWYREGGPSGRIIGAGSWIPMRVGTYNQIGRFDNGPVEGYSPAIYRHVYHFHVGNDESNHLVVGVEYF
jgi:RHS repeat-associated protein